MFRRSVVPWVVGLCPFLRRSQSKTLAELVLGAMSARRVSQADIGKSLRTKALPKHSIKRVSRFVGNHRVNIAEGCRGLVKLAAKSFGRCLVIAVDWVDVGPHKVLKRRAATATWAGAGTRRPGRSKGA